ncbi:MAG: 16S rRNA processing protein RimM [Prevotella sp.]|nr:16S rRNA processing protein RimM [Prevotella sp.]MBR6455317.1 16S rRNA processing protein RimM [Prevotella sp.]MBR6494260.1 16S rRNA processing protein RimM [Prevotella sp.]
MKDVYKIGRIGKPHGVKGEMNFMFTDDVFDRTDSDYLIIEVEGLLVPFFIEEYRFRSDETALLKLCDIDTQEQARQFTNCEVFFERSKADTPDDELTWAQIVGFRIVDENNGKIVGEIVAVDDSTENTLFEVQVSQRQVLIPASDSLIRSIDTQSQIITMTIPDGLLAL